MKKFDPTAFLSTIFVILALLGFSFLVILVKEYSYILQVQALAILGLVFIGHKLYNHFKSF